MSVPRFLERALDAAVPALGGIDRSAIRTKLQGTRVRLRFGEISADSTAGTGALLAANLTARLYPQVILDGPEGLVSAAQDTILAINPGCEVTTRGDSAGGTITLSFETGEPDVHTITVAARGWNVYIDSASPNERPPAAPAALAAACLGVAGVFRMVFADELAERGRLAPQPGILDLVGLQHAETHLSVPSRLSVPRLRLVGAGAIGQAAALTLSSAGVKGTVIAIDPESVELSNLQRYVLTEDRDEGRNKVELLAERLGRGALKIEREVRAWKAEMAREQLPTLTALDTPEDRIGVQASLPGVIYNAFTQPEDIGWSRHEAFGEEPCLACLYWPDGEGPGRHEQIAAAFKVHPLRALAYLLHRVPVGLPLPLGAAPLLPNEPPPSEMPEWYTRPLLEDIAVKAGVSENELTAWGDQPLADLYQNGICGGALLHLNVGEAPREVVVPLAHQSALAGVMLATQLIVAEVPELRAARPASVEARFDVLAALPQILARPRERADGCVCSDSVYRQVYLEKFARECESHESHR
jgi:hypothetical protein